MRVVIYYLMITHTLKNTIDNLCKKFNSKRIKEYRQLLVQK